MNPKKLGTLGEQYAAKYLQCKHYRILKMNFNCKYGEIDIIAENKGIIIFVEVKTRKSKNYGRGMEAVNFVKQQKIRKVALYYLKENPGYFDGIRFDVIDIILNSNNKFKIEHIENAF